MANQIPVKAIYSGSDVTSLGEFASSDDITITYLPTGTTSSTVALGDHTHATYLPLAGGTMTGNLVMGSNLVDGVDISARDAVLTSTATTASAAMPKAGGAFTGNVTTNGLIDGRDVAADGVTADAALPKAGGTMTGDLILGDSVKVEIGSASGGDLQLYHDGTHSYMDNITGALFIRNNGSIIMEDLSGNNMIRAIDGGAADLYHNGAAKLTTSTNGVTVTGGAVGTLTTDNDGSFDMSASNNFKCTPSGNFTLTFTNIVAQSGNILLVNSGGHTVSAHANTKVDAKILATISAAGTYLLAYFSDGTNVYMTNSAAYT